MKINHVITLFSLVSLISFTSLGLHAQSTEKSPKVSKELKKVLKELPPEIQLQVLRFAERQKAAYTAARIKREEVKISDEKMTPSKVVKVSPPEPVKVEKQVELAPQKAQEFKPTGTSDAGFSTSPEIVAPAAPPKPEYMQIAESMAPTTISWNEEVFDFGEVNEGEQPSHIFTFTNTGDKPLKITRVKPSCGCTTPSWSKEEIAPGKEGFVEVSYNSKNRPGMANKSITVTGNFEERTKVLRFKVNVIKAE